MIRDEPRFQFPFGTIPSDKVKHLSQLKTLACCIRRCALKLDIYSSFPALANAIMKYLFSILLFCCVGKFSFSPNKIPHLRFFVVSARANSSEDNFATLPLRSFLLSNVNRMENVRLMYRHDDIYYSAC